MACGAKWLCCVIAAWLFAGGLAAEESPSQETPSQVTYDDQVKAIFREHCFSCHNQERSTSDLALDSYARVIQGGSSGEVVLAGDLESSRLWALVSHSEEPVMPPKQDKLPDAKLAVIRAWIEGGALEKAGDTAQIKKKPGLAFAAGSGAAKPEGPAVMPEGIGREPLVVTERAAAVPAIAASPWAPLVAVAGQRQIVLYHADSAECLGIMPFPEGIAYSLCFSRQGDLLLAGGGHAAREGCAVVYDVRTGSRLTKVGEEYDAVLAADIDDTHAKIALGGPTRVVKIFSAQTGELLHEIRKHTDWIYAVQFSPDGVLLASCDRSGGVFVWEAETGRQYLDLRGHTGAVNAVAWRPDSNVLASCGDDGTIRLWEMNAGTQVKSIAAHGGAVTSVAFAQDGRLVSSGADRVAKLWDGEGNLKVAFPEFAEPALDVAITASGDRVVAGDWSGVVRMWAVEGAAHVADLPANPAPPN